MKILMLSSTFPYPPSRGGTQVRTFNLLKYLHRHHHVTLVTQAGEDVTKLEIEALSSSVGELAIFPRVPFFPGGGVWGKMQRFGRFLQQGTPPNVLHFYSPAMQKWVEEGVREGKWQVITCEHSINEIYLRRVWRVQKVLNIHSSVYGTCRQQLETGTSENLWRDRLQLPLLRRYEQQYTGKFAQIVVTTAEDRQQIQILQPQIPITVIPNGVDLEKFPYRPSDPGGRKLIFIGAMDNLANIDAVRFLALEVLPQLQQRYPGTSLTLVGANPTPAVQSLANCAGVTVTGKVQSMAEYLHQATICVVPMRTGYGIKNKTLEAMASGVPVVASDRGLEGIAVERQPGKTALRANRPEEYIAAIVRLFEEEKLRSELSNNARRLIEGEYTWELMGKRYEQVLIKG